MENSRKRAVAALAGVDAAEVTLALQTESVASAVSALRLAGAELCTGREWDGTCESDSGNGEEGED